ncbi:cell death specification protein 2 [Sitophilus oryzae]|uniref:Cell death specification protein 2 n=1 Tax=Sitophilus oryzae TaxID=7048 RepID=A0A6J2Y8L8_SITOR|nr:cell death specification protein 2 [Sitophilus oryzae]
METTSSYQFSNRSSTLLPPVPPFSTYHLLRNCNYLLTQESALKSFRDLSTTDNSRLSVTSDDVHLLSTLEGDKPCINLVPSSLFTPSNIIPYSPHAIHLLQSEKSGGPLSASNILPNPLSSPTTKKQRSEKKPIPNEQKDDKYFERRRRNNQAAKKSRDARKMREDQVALRATILEHENAILRAQVLTLREETSSLRQLLLQRKIFELPPRSQICANLTQ